MTPEANRLDAMVTAFEALQKAGYFHCDHNGVSLTSEQFKHAMVIAGTAVLAEEQENGDMQAARSRETDRAFLSEVRQSEQSVVAERRLLHTGES